MVACTIKVKSNVHLVGGGAGIQWMTMAMRTYRIHMRTIDLTVR